jgi:hypothetical protein
LLSVSRENPCPAKSDTFHGGWVNLFRQKATFEKIGFLKWSVPGTQSEVRIIHKIWVKPEQQ